jgi:Bacterial protein of unknown function (DUF885)
MFKSKSTATLCGAAIALVAACARPPAAGLPAPLESAAWSKLTNDYIEATFKAQPFFAVYAGRHEFDGEMPDLSKAGIDAEVTRQRAARTAALAIDATGMSDAQKFEREYLIAVIDDSLFWYTKAGFPFRNPAWYVNQLDPDIYLSRAYAPLGQRMRGYIGYARAIPAIAADVRKNLRTPMPRSFVEYAIKAFGGFGDFYKKDVPKVFASVADSAMQQELADADGAASQAMYQLRDWFIVQRKTANDGFAMGPNLFAEMVRDTESFDVPIAQIKTAGQADLARNTAALKLACTAFAPRQSLKDCVAKEQADKPPYGTIVSARAQLASLQAFIEAKNIVDIPGEEQALVAEAPPYNRANFAYIVIAGPYEKNLPSIYNIAPPDPAWSKAEQEEYLPGRAELLNTTVHEVWPGHFLQFMHSNRCKSIVARLWVGYAYAEGWAHYSEELMWDMGLGNGNPENHVAQLADALLRDVRLLSAIGLHTEGMTVAQSERMFREEAFQNRGNARQQAARGTFDPAYLNYTLGKLAIKKLRDDWVARQMAGKLGADPKSYWHDFHDQFLSYGGPPIPLVRRAMLGANDGSLL